MRYSVVIHKDPDTDYGVTAPDPSGCFTAGDTIDDALAQAVEAIECHIEGVMLDGEPIPKPSPIELHQKNPDYADGVWAFVSVDLNKLSSKSRRVNITLPERLLALVDQHAKQHGETRSGFIAQAALEFLASRDKAEG
jgi:predicted RNase H-like HicB family nuclease